LRLVERLIFFIIGAMLFAAAFALLWRAIIVLGELFASPGAHAMDAGAAFLDVVLLVLMVVELAYTVILSLGGIVLSAEPFLIVGLIAVIRRILVITVGEVQSDKASSQLTPKLRHRTRDPHRRRPRIRSLDRHAASLALARRRTRPHPHRLEREAASSAADFAERAHRAGGLAEIEVVTFGFHVHCAAEDGGDVVERCAGAHGRAQIDLVVAEET
jgi:uncharacterized membrane protein (DUF373 family)